MRRGSPGAAPLPPNDWRFSCEPRATHDSVKARNVGPAARQLQALVRRRANAYVMSHRALRMLLASANPPISTSPTPYF